MVTDQQVRRLKKLVNKEKNLEIAASKAGMSKKTACKYIKKNKLPSEFKTAHTWRTRGDPFEDVWEEVKEHLKVNSGLEAKTLFEEVQGKYPGDFSDGQLRTLQRKIKRWRALEGSAKEVFFAQKHYPGVLCASDFTNMNEFGIRINGQNFPHLIYHFVLTYSNWETGTICFSESFESLSEGLQNALWELGGVPLEHKTDQLTAAINKLNNPEEFTSSYNALLKHYGLIGKKTQVRCPNENGDIEQRHNRFKRAIEQKLLLSGGRDFVSRNAYEGFLKKLFRQLNSNRQDRFSEELYKLRQLPESRLNTIKKKRVKVGPGSTIHVQHNTYSVNSRLIGEWVDIYIYADYLEIWYAQKAVEKIPRVRGGYKSRINYRHIIDWLIRKPGAFENYRYRNDLFPTSRFKMAYDELLLSNSPMANKEYLKILYLSAKETEEGVDNALRFLLDKGETITSEAVEDLVKIPHKIPAPTDINIMIVNPVIYDELLKEVAYG